MPLNIGLSMRLSFPSTASNTYGKFHTSLNLSDVLFQSSSDEGFLRKRSFKATNIAVAVSVTILLTDVLPTLKLCDKDCYHSPEVRYTNVVSKGASAGMDFLNLSLPVPCWADDNNNPLLNSNISKTVRVSMAFTTKHGLNVF